MADNPIMLAADGTPVPGQLELNKTINLVAVPHYSDGTTGQPTANAEWALDPAGNGTITAGGALTLTKPGATQITATLANDDGTQITSTPVTITGVQLYALTVTAVTRKGGQTVTVDQAPANGELRRYKITNADAKPTVAYDQVLATADGWVEWPENGQITGTAGQVITVVHVTTQGAKARAVGTAVLPAPSTGTVESVAFTADTPVAGVLSHDYTLGCVLTPADADDQAVTWTSSDKTIADFTKTGAAPLHKILTTTAKAGTTKITVTTHDGNHTAEMTFTNSVAPTGIEVTPNPITMRVGEALDPAVNILPAEAYQGVVITSDDPDIVSVVDDSKAATVDESRVGEARIG
ncbi:Ig-like domain-containing protein [Bifidobacterium callitrichos]|uniref:BIG2 domain-containing protein n=1 Tax=Bifidobacterium callitrichos DSM 23973 TaxID=1437609 RepID=A0A087ACT5_9BIFI|nr:Ig-like domain-containing protein [Bifidobacterium callitrichos]KFI56585.1 hypothetical protein BCAL_0182 [Bifidobacterium callitrichos DSM 23973]